MFILMARITGVTVTLIPNPTMSSEIRACFRWQIPAKIVRIHKTPRPIQLFLKTCLDAETN